MRCIPLILKEPFRLGCQDESLLNRRHPFQMGHGERAYSSRRTGRMCNLDSGVRSPQKMDGPRTGNFTAAHDA